MKTKILGAIAIAALIVGLPLLCFSATQTVTVRAFIPTQSTLNLTVSRVPVSGGNWTNATSIDFGNLTYNSTLGIFTASSYYAVDCGVNDNTGNAWTLAHSHSAVVRTAGNETLDDHINVDFVRQVNSTNGTTLAGGEVSLANSGITWTKAQLTGGWLRIYYGIGTGSGDNTGVTPINGTQPGGNYTGSVTLTLAP